MTILHFIRLKLINFLIKKRYVQSLSEHTLKIAPIFQRRRSYYILSENFYNRNSYLVLSHYKTL